MRQEDIQLQSLRPSHADRLDPAPPGSLRAYRRSPYGDYGHRSLKDVTSIMSQQPVTIIGVGPARTASTWLFNVLIETGLVDFTKPKEISYFNQHYVRGLDWYGRQFTDFDRKFRVDITPHYIDTMEICKRIYRDLPEAVVIVGVRDPLERIRSMFETYFYDTRSYRVEDYERYFRFILPRQILIADRIAFLRDAFGSRLVFLRFDELRATPVDCARGIMAQCGITGSPPAISRSVIHSHYTLKEGEAAAFFRSLFHALKRVLPAALALKAKAEIGQKLFMDKVRLDSFLGEERLQQIIAAHRTEIEDDHARVKAIALASTGSP